MLIGLKNELIEREAQYQQTLRDQWVDLKVASERVDSQVAELQQTQRDELALLEVITRSKKSLIFVCHLHIDEMRRIGSNVYNFFL